MKIKNLLLLAAFLATSGGAMAQTTTLTATNGKVVPGYSTQTDATISFEAPETISGWQMVLSLPEGLSIESAAGQLTIGEGSADATVFSGVKNSSLFKDFQIIGGENEGDVYLVCVPTAKEQEAGNSGQLCTIKLKAADTFEGTQAVKIKSFLASDPTGAKTFEAAEASFNIVGLKCDVNGNGTVNVADVRQIVNAMKLDNPDAKFDVNGNGKVNVADVRAAVNEMKL